MKQYEVKRSSPDNLSQLLIGNDQYVHALRLLSTDVASAEFRNVWRTYVLSVYAAAESRNPSAEWLNGLFNEGISVAAAVVPNTTASRLVSNVELTDEEWDDYLYHDIYGELVVPRNFPDVADCDYGMVVSAIDNGLIYFRSESG